LIASTADAVLVGLASGIVVIGAALWLFSRCVKIVQQGSVGVVKRLGEFRAVGQPGMHILAPFVDRMEKVDVREFPMTSRRSSRRTTCPYK